MPRSLAGDEALTAAILDRLPRSARVINIKGRGYRLRDLDHALGESARTAIGDAFDRVVPSAGSRVFVGSRFEDHVRETDGSRAVSLGETVQR